MNKKTMNSKTKRNQRNAFGRNLVQGAGPVLSDLLQVIEVAASDERMLEGAGPVLSDLLRRLRPSAQASGHFKTARLEFFKGLQAYLEARMEQASKAQAKGEKINIE
jgi:hypothetical protein